MIDMFRVGVITQPHGVRGEMKVFPTTDDPRRFEDLDTVILDTGKEKRNLTIQSVKYQKNLVILKCKEVNDRNEVELLRKAELYVTRDQAVELEEGEYFIADLLGCKVVSDEGEDLGVLDDVLQTGANDVYSVKKKGEKELLIPVIPQCVLNVDIEKKEILVHLLEGLRD
ncbi:MAG: ribosome maturation factor RimM [Agathobacter sp.]|nr:ribosome maturation factor RimM [Agathobacter sp.]